MKKGKIYIALFAVWTVLLQIADVRPAGETATKIGFATFNIWFHKWTGVHMSIYYLTDWLGLVPVFICILFGILGFVQLIKRRSIKMVDYDIIFLGIYYIIVIFCYLIFEMVQLNYRPILIEGIKEVSYPSSTTLLVLSVMPTLVYQAKRRLHNENAIKRIYIFSVGFSLFMVLGRTIAGVHWFTDIVGSVLLSAGLFNSYKEVVSKWNSMKNFRN